MKPVSPVVEGFQEIIFSKDQPQYLPLPAIKLDSGRVISRWKMTWRERLRVLFCGDLWLHQLTFNQPLQPQLPTVHKPKLEYHYVHNR